MTGDVERRAARCEECGGAGFIEYDDGWRYGPAKRRCGECGGTGDAHYDEILVCSGCDAPVIDGQCTNEDCGYCGGDVSASVGATWIAEPALDQAA